MKTARFASIVEAAGAPSPHPLWLAPENDPALQRAIRDNRVMTVHQNARGTRKDYATVGFDPQPEAQYLFFPKSLRRFRERRIVGIDYALLAQETTPPASSAESASSRKKAAPAKKPSKVTHSSSASENVVPFAPEPTPSVAPTPSRPNKPAPKSSPKSANATPRDEKPRKPAGKSVEPRVKPTVAPPPSVPADVLKQLRRVSSDLKAGKAVAAYERLQDVLRQLE